MNKSSVTSLQSNLICKYRPEKDTELTCGAPLQLHFSEGLECRL